MTPEREAEIRAVLNGDLSVDMDTLPVVLSRAADDLLDEVDRLRDLLNPTEGEDDE